MGEAPRGINIRFISPSMCIQRALPLIEPVDQKNGGTGRVML
jgi:hypothetical protein